MVQYQRVVQVVNFQVLICFGPPVRMIQILVALFLLWNFLAAGGLFLDKTVSQKAGGALPFISDNLLLFRERETRISPTTPRPHGHSQYSLNMDPSS